MRRKNTSSGLITTTLVMFFIIMCLMIFIYEPLETPPRQDCLGEESSLTKFTNLCTLDGSDPYEYSVLVKEQVCEVR